MSDASPPADRSQAGPWWRRSWLLAIVGATVAVAVVAIVTMRLGNRTDAARGPTVAPITITRPVKGAPFDGVFTWRPADGASAYQVSIFASDGTPSFEVRDLKVPGVKLAESMKLAPGSYLVQVIGFANGATVAESPRTPFDVK
jgi:hypothetical protein